MFTHYLQLLTDQKSIYINKKKGHATQRVLHNDLWRRPNHDNNGFMNQVVGERQFYQLFLRFLVNGGVCDSDPLAESRRELVELIDWCRYVVSREPSAVTALVHHMPGVDPKTPVSMGERDYQCLSLRFAAADAAPEVMCQLSCGQYIPAAWHEAISFRPPSAMQICCEHGVAFIDLPSTLVWFDEAGRHLESLETEMSVGEQMLTQFHRTVTSLVRRRNDLDDAFRAASVLYAADQSSAECRQISLPRGMQPVAEVVKTLASEHVT